MSIQYILIGNPEDCEEIGHYPERGASKSVAKEAFQIFKKLSESGIKTKDLRNKVDNRGKGYYYFTINSHNIFYLILGDKNLREREAFELIDTLQQENIPLSIDSRTGKLNIQGRQQLKSLVEDFMNNKSNKIQGIQNDVEQVKGTMQQNIKKMYTNVEDVENMEQKARKLKEGAQEYNNSAVKLKRATCWQNFKWLIILIAVIVLLIIIIIPVSLRK
jgi:ABC-type multidrug transport system fused ATPase/permease subunit